MIITGFVLNCTKAMTAYFLQPELLGAAGKILEYRLGHQQQPDAEIYGCHSRTSRIETIVGFEP